MYEDESITEGLRVCVCVRGVYKCGGLYAAVYGILTMSAAISSSS